MAGCPNPNATTGRTGDDKDMWYDACSADTCKDGVFEIDGSSGQIRTKSGMRYRLGSYRVKVTVTSDAFDTDSAIVYINPTSRGRGPGAPRNLRATSSKGQVELTWDAPSNRGHPGTIEGYRIEFSTCSNPNARSGCVWKWLAEKSSGSATSHTDTHQPNDATRHYRVRAMNPYAAGRAASNVASATISKIRPELVSAKLSENGRQIRMAFASELDGDSAHAPGPPAFRVTAENRVRGIRSVTVNGSDKEVLLDLWVPIAQGQEILLSHYSAGRGVDGTRAIQTPQGVDARGFQDYPVVTAGPVLLRTATNEEGTQIALIFDEVLSDTVPGKSNFTVTADGNALTIGTVTLSILATALLLENLSPAIQQGQEVRVSYEGRPGTDPLANLNGAEAPAFSNRVVVNSSTVPRTAMQSEGPDTLTAEFTNVPDDHEGVQDNEDTSFEIKLALSEEPAPGFSYKVFRGDESATLTFAAGETSRTVTVPILQDGVDEDSETFTLTLSNATGNSAYLVDNTATGTITNDDPMPKAWLSRFGRTLAGQVVEAVGSGFDGTGGNHLTVGGMTLDTHGELVSDEEAAEPTRLGIDDLAWMDPVDGTRTMTGREVMLGSAFQLSTGGEHGKPAITGWGRFSVAGFEADVDGTAFDGRATTGLAGADIAGDRWLGGLAVSFSQGQGDFSLIEGEDTGEVENSLTALYPYAKVGINDKVDVWGLVGFGSGELTLIQHADSQRMKEQQYTTDIAMRMGALGVRGQVLTPEDAGAMSLAVKSDAFWIRMDSDAVENDDGRLAASQADANRVRIIVEGSRAFETGTGTLTPSAEIGLRHDGGDAETGAGIEAGAGLRFEGAGFSIEGAVRSLVAHEASGYEEWGASGAIRIAPGDSGRGLSFTLAPTFGTTGSRIDQLWSAQDTGRLGEGKFEAGQRLEAELGYGIAVPRTRGLLTPYAGLSLAEGAGRTWRTGLRWKVAPEATLGVEAIREDGRQDNGPADSVLIRAAVHW